MARSIGLFSDKRINPKHLARVMDYLHASPVNYGWQLTRGECIVWVELANDNLPLIPEDYYEAISEELGAEPQTMISLMLGDFDENYLDWRMARAVGIALAEHWPIVWHDYSGPVETLLPPAN